MNYCHCLFVVIGDEKNGLNFEQLDKNASVIAKVEQRIEPFDGERAFEKYDGGEDSPKVIGVPELKEDLAVHPVNSCMDFDDRS